MNSSALGTLISSVLLGLVCLAQLARLAMRVEVVIGGHRAPFWLSAVAFVVTGTLSVWLWRIAMGT